jgi:hypothetical protein
VLIALANHAHDDGSRSFISQETIAREARLTDRQVRRCLKELEASGEIVRTGTRGKGGVIVWRIAMRSDMSTDNMSGAGSTSGQIVQPVRTNGAAGVSDMSDEPLRNRHEPGRRARARASTDFTEYDERVIG